MPITKDEVAAIIALKKVAKLKTHQGWMSFNQGNSLPNALVIDIDDIASLQTVMQKVYELNKKKAVDQRITLRAAAGGLQDNHHSDSYSFSPCAQADVIVRLVGDDFLKIENIDGNPMLVKAGASLQIGAVDKALYQYFDLSLPTSSLIPYVTVAGLSATAGHGTGKEQPSFAGLIEAMTLCLPNGEIVRVDRQHPDFETIRSAHLGLFGIVIDVELRCTKAKKIKCTMDVNSVPEFIAKVKDGLFTKYPYVSAMYMPTYYEDELTRQHVNNVIVYIWEPIDTGTPDINNHPELSHFTQSLSLRLNDNFKILDLLRAFPTLIPCYMRYVASKIAIGDNDRTAIGPWYDMAHYQTAFPADLTEFGPLFEVSDEAKNGIATPEMITAFEKLVSELSASAAKGEYPLVYAAYLRYFQGTNGGLSMSMHQPAHHVCSLDMTTAHNAPGFTAFTDRMSQFAYNELNAKPHWGKNIPTDLDFTTFYGEHLAVFASRLDAWYKEHGMDLSKSALLNHVFAHVIAPQYAVAPPNTATNRYNIQPLCTSKEAETIAQALLNTISDDDSEEAKQLSKALKGICSMEKQTCPRKVMSTLFSCLRRNTGDATLIQAENENDGPEHIRVVMPAKAGI